jgi:hypothetical protein
VPPSACIWGGSQATPLPNGSHPISFLFSFLKKKIIKVLNFLRFDIFHIFVFLGFIFFIKLFFGGISVFKRNLTYKNRLFHSIIEIPRVGSFGK